MGAARVVVVHPLQLTKLEFSRFEQPWNSGREAAGALRFLFSRRAYAHTVDAVFPTFRQIAAVRPPTFTRQSIVA